MKLLHVEFIQLSPALSHLFATRFDRCDEQIDITIDSDAVITRNLFQEFIVMNL